MMGCKDMRASISFNQSHKSNMSHNNRENTFGNPDIDKNKTHLNIEYVRKSIQGVYEEIFDESVKEYNANQKRADRKIGDYYTKIHNDSKTHEQRELIVAVGKKDDAIDSEKKKIILDIYAKQFQATNPNLAVYNMVLHLDEANPHLHINYVPNFESSKGLKKRVGMDKALQQQGISGKGMDLIGKWREQETAKIENLAKEHIPNFERDNIGRHKYMKVRQYKEYAEVKSVLEVEIEKQLELKKELHEKIKAQEERYHAQDVKIARMEQEWQKGTIALKKQKSVLETENKSLEKVIKQNEEIFRKKEQEIDIQNELLSQLIFQNGMKHESIKELEQKEETMKTEIECINRRFVEKSKELEKIQSNLNVQRLEQEKRLKQEFGIERSILESVRVNRKRMKGIEVEKETKGLTKKITGNVIIDNNDWEFVKNLAVSSEANKQKLSDLKEDTEILVLEHRNLKKKYEETIEENKGYRKSLRELDVKTKLLEKVLDKVKISFPIAHFIGKAKAQILTKMNEKLLNSFFKQEEISGAQEYLKEKEEQGRKQREMRRKHVRGFDLEL
jgi:hypothetical protein